MGTIANEKAPPATLEELAGPIPSHRSAFGSKPDDLSTFFPITPFPLLPKSVSLDHFPAEKAKAGLRALEGGSLLEAALGPHPSPATILACSAGTLGRETTNNSAV